MFKSFDARRAARRAARFAANAQAISAAHVAPAVDLTDPAAHVEILFIVQPTGINGGPPLDMDTASKLNFAFDNARGTWAMKIDGTECLTVRGPAAEVAKWIAAYGH